MLDVQLFYVRANQNASLKNENIGGCYWASAHSLDAIRPRIVYRRMSETKPEPPPGGGWTSAENSSQTNEGERAAAAPVAEGKAQTEEQLSALRENLARKGKNSYYYAHDRVMDTPSWDGRQAPRRLATAAKNQPAPKKPEKVTNYAWANEQAKVKIYVPQEGCSEIDDANISLKWEAKSVDIEVTLPSGGSRRLHLPLLHDEIVGATLRKKQDKFIVTLVKKDEVTWYDLTTNSR